MISTTVPQSNRNFEKYKGKEKIQSSIEQFLEVASQLNYVDMKDYIQYIIQCHKNEIFSLPQLQNVTAEFRQETLGFDPQLQTYFQKCEDCLQQSSVATTSKPSSDELHKQFMISLMLLGLSKKTLSDPCLIDEDQRAPDHEEIRKKLVNEIETYIKIVPNRPKASSELAMDITVEIFSRFDIHKKRNPYKCIYNAESESLLYISTGNCNTEHTRQVLEIHNKMAKRIIFINAGNYGSSDPETRFRKRDATPDDEEEFKKPEQITIEAVEKMRKDIMSLQSVLHIVKDKVAPVAPPLMDSIFTWPFCDFTFNDLKDEPFIATLPAVMAQKVENLLENPRLIDIAPFEVQFEAVIRNNMLFGLVSTGVKERLVERDNSLLILADDELQERLIHETYHLLNFASDEAKYMVIEGVLKENVYREAIHQEVVRNEAIIQISKHHNLYEFPFSTNDLKAEAILLDNSLFEVACDTVRMMIVMRVMAGQVTYMGSSDMIKRHTVVYAVAHHKNYFEQATKEIQIESIIEVSKEPEIFHPAIDHVQIESIWLNNELFWIAKESIKNQFIYKTYREDNLHALKSDKVRVRAIEKLLFDKPEFANASEPEKISMILKDYLLFPLVIDTIKINAILADNELFRHNSADAEVKILAILQDNNLYTDAPEHLKQQAADIILEKHQYYAQAPYLLQLRVIDTVMKRFRKDNKQVFDTAPRQVKIETHLRLQELVPKSCKKKAIKKWLELDRLDLKAIKEGSNGKQSIKEDYTDLEWKEDIPITCAGWEGTYTGTAKQFEVVLDQTRKEIRWKPHGVGRFIYDHGGWIYEGQFKKGKLHGFVRVIYFDGSYFRGKMEKNQWVKTQYHNQDDSVGISYGYH